MTTRRLASATCNAAALCARAVWRQGCTAVQRTTGCRSLTLASAAMAASAAGAAGEAAAPLSFRATCPGYDAIIGLVGTIASGKSHAREHLASLGALTVDADKLGHEAYARGTRGYDRLVAEFSPAILDADGACVGPAARYNENGHWVAIGLPRRTDLALHGLIGFAFALLADRPGVHILRYVSERRDLADLVEVFFDSCL